jgi:hypothetical protein
MNIHTITRASYRQNADLTFKYNLHEGRHGWLRLTPAYSVRLVKIILEAGKPGIKVLDPFSGTGTTALCAAYMGFSATGLEINPFLYWFSQVKAGTYAAETIGRTKDLGKVVLDAIRSPKTGSAAPPPIHNIERWWSHDALGFLCRLKAAIAAAAEPNSPEHDLLLVAFCRTLIKHSNAAFNHQSMSFKKANNEPALFPCECDYGDSFLKELLYVLEGAEDNPEIEPKIVLGDARTPSRFLKDRHDLLITSPPYPNRISYIRELRPYMYWLGYLSNGRDAGEFDWQTIGGTWGIATSRLTDWRPSSDAFVPDYLNEIIRNISAPANKNGALLANYIAKYFEDIWNHIRDISSVLSPGAEVHYIVGNSTFYDVVLPVEMIYRDMLAKCGFEDAHILRIRKRNSKRELFEFDVVARK